MVKSLILNSKFGTSRKIFSPRISPSKRYIREIDEEKLCKFLRICTGSNLVVSEAIHVQFTVQTDFTRRPIRHTCGMVLELSDSYDNFPQFRAEFNCVLDSNIWVMDIV